MYRPNTFSSPDELEAMMSKTLREDAKIPTVSTPCFDKVHLACGYADCGCECHQEDAKGTPEDLIRELVDALRIAEVRLRNGNDSAVVISNAQHALQRAKDAGYG